MRILIVSDTHGNQSALFMVREVAGPVDAIIHLGDGEVDAALLSAVEEIPLLRIAGNCDLGSSAPRELVCEWKGVRLLLCHGDRYGVKTGLSRLIERGIAAGVDGVLYGHTHQALAEQHDGLWLINPGTLTYPAPVHSYAILNITVTGLEVTIHSLS